MGVDRKAAFGLNNAQPLGARRNGAKEEEFVASEYWVNLGYNVDLENEQGETSSEFIRLNRGIPLDHVKQVQTNSSNDFFFMKASAQNAFLGDFREACKALQPGESKFIEGPSGLVIELHRVKAQREAVKTDENPFVRKFSFV